MKIHKNARLTPKGREILVRRIVNGGLRVEEAAQASGVSVRTAYKWLARYRAQGRRRSPGPFFASCHGCPHRTSEEQRARRFWPCAAPDAPIARLAEEPGWRTARWAGSPSRGD